MLTRSLLNSFSRFGTIMLAGYLAWLGWDQLGPHKPEIGPVRREAADEAVSAIVEELRQNCGDVGPVVLVHFGNDPSDHFSNQLRSTLEQRGVFDLLDRAFVEKTRALVNLRDPSVISPDAAIELAEARGASAVLFGRLLTFEATPGAAILDVEYALVDVESGETIHAGRYSNSSSASELLSGEATAYVRSFPWFKRALGWIVIVLLLPVFTITFIRTMVGRGSNGANAFVLGIYTWADTLLAYLLVGAALAGFWSVLVFLAAVIAAFVYNVRIMSFAVKLEG